MNVQVNITLNQGEELAQKVTDMVPAIMEAIGGDLTKDSISMQVSASSFPPPPTAVPAQTETPSEPRVIGG